MWIYSGVENFLVRASHSETTIAISLTNLIHFWQLVMNRTEVLRRFQEANPLFDMAEDVIIQTVVDMYQSEDGVSHCIKITEDNLPAEIKSCGSIKVYPYSFTVQLPAADIRKMYEEWTNPLLCLLNAMNLREEKLLAIIRAKDLEIAQYKEEGAEIKRTTVITKPFREESLKEDNQGLEHPASIFRGRLAQKLSSIKSSSNQIKEEKIESNAVKSTPLQSTATPTVNCFIGPAASKRPKKTALRL